MTNPLVKERKANSQLNLFLMVNQTFCAYLSKTIVFALIVFFLIGCEKTGSVIRQNFDEFTIQEQINIGNTMKQEIETMQDVFPIMNKLTNKCAYDRLDILFNTLVTTSVVKNRKEFDWSLYIIDNDQIKNAFTLPGGHIYIYSGLIKFLKTESQLVAVLGNEIAYADDEYTLNTLREEHGNLTLGDLSLGNSVPNLPEILTNLPYTQYNDSFVKKADSISISLICPFQYDAGSLQSFIESASASSIEWVSSKRGGDINNRIQEIESLTGNCGMDEGTFEARYQTFLMDCF